MRFPFYIAKRYLFAKKSQNAINIITIISTLGVALGSMALIVILSVFNGFDNLIQSLFNSFEPDLIVLAKEGKVFSPDTIEMDKLYNHPEVLYVSETIEENALLKNKEKQYIATIKGVDDYFANVSGIDSMIYEGAFILKEKGRSYAVIGQGVAYYLSAALNYTNPLSIYVPKRMGNISFNPENAFNRKLIFPSGIFRIEQNYDTKYVIVPIDFARELLDYTKEVSALEIRLKDYGKVDKVQKELQELLGTGFTLKNRYQQNELFYKIMRSEKWAIFFILTFIIIIAAFNIIGSLTMLIIDKRRDISVLRSMGANHKTVRIIFLLEGWMISLIGVIMGLLLGILICWLQERFGLIRLKGSGSFVIDAYPVALKALDLAAVFFTVSGLGFLTAWYPVRYISKKYELVNN